MEDNEAYHLGRQHLKHFTLSEYLRDQGTNMANLTLTSGGAEALRAISSGYPLGWPAFTNVPSKWYATKDNPQRQGTVSIIKA